MGTNLGELGKTRAAVDMTFQWFGETMRVGEDAGDLGLIDFLEMAEEIDEKDVVAAMKATKSFLRGQVHPDDWPRLIELARLHHQQFSDLMELSKAIVEAVAKLPTGRPSDSYVGRPSTPQKLRGGSSSAGDVQRALDMLAGRPDLKMIVWQAQRDRDRETADA